MKKISALAVMVLALLLWVTPKVALASSPPPIPSFVPTTPDASETGTDTTDITTTTTGTTTAGTTASRTASTTSSGPADIVVVVGLAVVSVWSLKKYFHLKKYSL